ncbi:MAG TPA: MoxR family ATPase [Armatimonadota bacterium]|nr:MoxR family ATPase [Armatimonadota bacterium]
MLTSGSTRTSAITERIMERVGQVIVGQRAVITEALIALMSGGHVLLEGVPGTAKTLLVKTMASALGREFGRVQLTPDLMPSDIVGTYVFESKTGDFRLRKGPIFTSMLLADEINRAPAKTQSALLEGMQEMQVTIDGITHPLDSGFTVFATQNPVEFEGTYPLPEAQLDRFMLKIIVDYPQKAEEDDLLLRVHRGQNMMHLGVAEVEACVSAEEMDQCRAEIANVRAEDAVVTYVGDVVRATRTSPHLVLGCSPRAAVMALMAAKAYAAMNGRDFLTPDDVKAVSVPALRHRVILRPEADIEGMTADDVIRGVLSAIPVPR